MKFFLKKYLFLVFLLVTFFTTSSCARWVANFLPERPDSAIKFGDDVSPDFKQGWHDGCESGMSAGNSFYTSFYRNNTIDGYKITSSPEYKQAWYNSYWFCYRSDFVKQKSSIWGGAFSGFQ